MAQCDPMIHHYLPKRIRGCPECGDRDRVQIVVFGMPAVPPTPDEEDRVLFAGCVMFTSDDPEQESPKWHCPSCDLSYTGRGEVVTGFDLD
jgi:hypothetical protein